MEQSVFILAQWSICIFFSPQGRTVLLVPVVLKDKTFFFFCPAVSPQAPYVYVYTTSCALYCPLWPFSL